MSEQVTRLAVIQNATANGTMQRALGSLGFAPEAELGLIAKQSGLSREQVGEWLSGTWTPPTDQLLVVQGLALERFQRVIGTGQLVAS